MPDKPVKTTTPSPALQAALQTYGIAKNDPAFMPVLLASGPPKDDSDDSSDDSDDSSDADASGTGSASVGDGADDDGGEPSIFDDNDVVGGDSSDDSSSGDSDDS